ncbi:MAG: GNAT family N-acetyltransferase [Clostridia bacterium]|nr:GNAT family N-acetyltransferase [Clostridia bacterium]
MLTFKKITKKNVFKLAPYFCEQALHMSDFSVGFQFMWNGYLKPDYTFAGNCLVIREKYDGKYYFHFPLSKGGRVEEEAQALDEIERHCRDSYSRLLFTNVPKSRLPLMTERYGSDLTMVNTRKWRDYLYRAEDFCEYPGKKYAGQRNHVNKFKKSYPDASFRPFQAGDEGEIVAFLREYEEVQRAKGTFLAQTEMNEVHAIVPYLKKYGFLCGLLRVNGKLVALSVGEKCGDMIVVHVEKALRQYEGAYPTVAQLFARTFCDESVRFLNRMDDGGDGGLRKSKLQYHPVELADKYNLLPNRAIDRLKKPPTLSTERLTLAPLKDGDGDAYARLAGDVERNRFWGYDYRADYRGEGVPSGEWFLNIPRRDFKRKNELSLGIYREGTLVGEGVLHRFGYREDVEVGVRLLPEAEGVGYAAEAVKALISYAIVGLGIERVDAKCFRENEKSAKMLLSAGMKHCGEDETYFYFYKTPAM